MTAIRNEQRPLTARSVIASTLLGVRPPVLPAQALVRSGELFGIAEGTTRVALSRMVAAGELAADDGRYRLAGHLLRRQERQEQSRHPALRPWDGTWRTAIVTADRRPARERAALRDAMGRARLAELREGVWTRPANLAIGVDVAAGVCTWADARFDDPGTVARRLWDLDRWAATARALRDEVRRWLPALERNELDALAPTFVLSAAVLRHFQADPLLPPELLPARWPGDALRADYERFDTAFKATWRAWYRAFRG